MPTIELSIIFMTYYSIGGPKKKGESTFVYIFKQKDFDEYKH